MRIEVKETVGKKNSKIVFGLDKNMRSISLELSKKPFRNNEYKTTIQFVDNKTQTYNSLAKDEDTLMVAYDESELNDAFATFIVTQDINLSVKGTDIKKKYFVALAIRYLLEMSDVRRAYIQHSR